MGNWIGGDRDGNPNVTADTLRMALARQAETALRFYLTEVHELGAELSMSAHAGAGDAGDAGAGRRARPTTTRTASDEPYRRALIGMYARLAATLHALTGTEALRHAVAPQNPYADAGEFLRRPARHRAPRCSRTTRRRWSAPRLAPLMRAVQVFGFHLATVDLRQSSDKHEAVVAELLRVARIEPDYSRAGRGRHAARCCCALLNDARPLRVRGADYSRAGARRAGDLRDRARDAARATAARRCATTSSRTPKTVSDLLEVLLLQKEAGLLRGTLRRRDARRPT